MTYGRILTPRFFIDTPNWLMSRGVASSEFSVKATNTGNHFVGPDSGFVDAELFDMRPSNQVVFSTKDDSTSQEDHVLIVIDTQGTTERKHFVAILNHLIDREMAKQTVLKAILLSLSMMQSLTSNLLFHNINSLILKN